MSPILQAVLVLLLLGLVLGLVIGIVSRLFGVEQDPRLEETEALLPGANCGACGFAGCADFAKALVGGKAEVGQCTSISAENCGRVAALLGMDAGMRAPKVAVVRCRGGQTQAEMAAEYNGVNDCRSAMLVAGGAKGCRYGCLGLGTCARNCPFGAIEIKDGLAVVDPELCTGCGKCVATCPRGLIILVPKSAPIHVLCHSPEKGAVCKKVCSVSCIGCRKCVKNAEEGQMTMDGFLARVNYENPPGPELAKVCPTGCLQATKAGKDQAEKPEDAEIEVTNG